MRFLYDLPNWLLGVTVVVPILLLTYLAYFAFQRRWRPAPSDQEVNVAMAVLGVVATVNSLLLAFIAVSVWESHSAAEEAVVEEANTVSALARDLAVYDSGQSREVRRLLRDYADRVVKVEWHDMQRGRANVEVWNNFDRMYLAIGAIDPDTPRREALLSEIWGRTNGLLEQRRRRLLTSESKVSRTLWTVSLAGAVLTIVSTFVLPPTRFHLWMIGLVTMSIGLVFFLVVAMDRPFAGKESISPEPFLIAIANMERWDAEIRPDRRR